MKKSRYFRIKYINIFESVSWCCSLHGLQDVHELSGCRTSISDFPQAPSDQVQQSLVADGLHQLRTTLGGREVAGAHLHQEHTETEDVHLGTLESWVVGLGGSVHWTAGILCLQLTLEVGGAVVGDLGQPASVGRRLEEDVGTAEVPVDDGVGRHVVEVVESAGHVDCDGEEVLQREMLSGTSVDQSSETGRHELCLAISSLSSQICRFGRERRKLNMREECCSELL